MTHLQIRLEQRYGITGVSSARLKYLVMNQGEALFKHKNATIYKIKVRGVDVYALLCAGDKDPNTQVVTTVYTKSDVDRIMSKEPALCGLTE